MAEVMAIRQRMTAAEFKLLPESSLPTELINGELIVSASPKDDHQQVSGELYSVIKSIMAGGTLRFAPMDLYLDDANVPQPDLFWVAPESRCKLGEDGYWYGPPELIVEIFSPSSIKRDKIDKFNLYERHGVLEYWIVDPMAKYLEVWQLVNGKYALYGVFGAEHTFVSTVLGEKPIQVRLIFGS